MHAAPPPVKARFDRRSDLPELMDDLQADPALTRRSLRELAFLNTSLGAYDVLYNAFQGLKNRVWATDGRPLRVLDLACGSGDVLRKLSRWADRQNLPFQGIGVDVNPVMIRYSQELSNGFSNLEFIEADIYDPAMEALQADVVVNSQFCHHLTDAELVTFLQRMQTLAGQAVVISDLHRHPLAFYSIRLLTQLFSKSIQVKYDAPLSVLRGMTRQEWKSALAAAGIKNYRLRWMWAFRWQIVLAARA